MAMKQLTGNVDYIKWADVEIDAEIGGFYMDSKESSRFPGNFTHYVETTDGRKLGLTGNANLDRAFEQIRKGWYVQVTYKGMTTLQNGNFKGSECHQFAIAYDDERVHSFYSGDPSVRADVQYKNESDESVPEQQQQQNAAPALVKPGTQVPAQQSQPQQQQTQQAPAAESSKPKRSVF